MVAMTAALSIHLGDDAVGSTNEIPIPVSNKAIKSIQYFCDSFPFFSPSAAAVTTPFSSLSNVKMEAEVCVLDLTNTPLYDQKVPRWSEERARCCVNQQMEGIKKYI